MNRWVARLLGLILAAAAMYLVYANVHAGSTLLECTLAAAVLAIATVFLAWKRPVAALILNVVWLAGAFAATASLTPTHQLPNLVAQSGEAPSGAPPSQQTPGASATTNVPTASNAWQDDTADPSIRAANETAVPTIMLGTSQVDDGIVEESYAQKTVAAGSAAAAQFGAIGPATPDPKIAAARQLEAAIPNSEYNLERLADTLPSDPVAIYRFVRDNVGTDIYAGSMRGPLGAWMGRAGNSADKARLLAYLLAKKGIAARFDRGTLSDAERAQVLSEASATQRVIVLPKDADAARDTNAIAAAGVTFASWATPKLQAANAPLATGALDATRVPAQHYWIRVYASGKQIDLDPTLSAMHEGQHLGTTDTAFKESPLFPNDDTMHVRVRLIATSGGSQTILAEATGAIPDIAYSPLIAGITPKDGNPQTLDTAIVFGSTPKSGKPISTSQLPDSLALQVDRASGAGATVSVRRTIFERSSAGANAAQAITGIHTIVLAPGSAPMLFLYETFRDARVLRENADAQAAGKKKPNQGLYPALLAAFYSRDDVLAATLGDRNGIRLFRDRPDVVMLHVTVAGANGSQTTYRKVFDIADNGTNAVASPSALAAANLARGWGDTWIERDLLPDGTGAMTAWLANKKTATYAVGKNVPDSLDGANVALQASGGQQQWWDIDPSSASVVGRLPGGWGTEGEEEGSMLASMQQAYDVYEINETDKECEDPGPACQEAICKLTVSGIPIAASVAGATIKGAGIVLAFLSVKAVAQGCGGLNPGGGEGGGEGGGGGGGGNPSPDDGNGPG